MATYFPRGETLPVASWQARHRTVLVILAAHAVLLPVGGLLMGRAPALALGGGAIVATLGLCAWLLPVHRRVHNALASAALLASSMVLVPLSGGLIEAHFHFFVVTAVIFLYEDWLPLFLSIPAVAIHHALVGVLMPAYVYNHPHAVAHPFLWAGVHSAFILGQVTVHIVAWNAIDRSRRAEQAAQVELLQTRRQLAAQEKMAAFGLLASGLAHEVRTPLTVVSVNASLLARRLERADAAPDAVALQAIDEIHAGIDRMNGLVGQLRRFSRGETDERIVVNLGDIVSDAVRLLAPVKKPARPVRLHVGRTPEIRAHVMGVQQIVINLVNNAVEAASATHGEVRVATFTRDGRACLSVEDGGPGIPAEVRDRMFEPLFTTKAQGTGIGLAIVRKIAYDHGATIDCVTAPGRGARFTVSFPPAAVGSPTIAPPPEAPAVAPSPPLAPPPAP